MLSIDVGDNPSRADLTNLSRAYASAETVLRYLKEFTDSREAGNDAHSAELDGDALCSLATLLHKGA